MDIYKNRIKVVSYTDIYKNGVKVVSYNDLMKFVDEAGTDEFAKMVHITPRGCCKSQLAEIEFENIVKHTFIRNRLNTLYGIMIDENMIMETTELDDAVTSEYEDEWGVVIRR